MNHTTVKHNDYVVGIDLGGTKIRAGIATLDGLIVADMKVATNPDGFGLIEQLVGLVKNLCQSSGVPLNRVLATAIGGAGVPNGNGSFHLAPNLTGIDDAPFTQALAQQLGHPVILENDVNVAAIGELHYGVGLGVTDFVYISVGTGIGMGIVANGQLVRGSSGQAGEVGFLPFGTDPFEPAHHVRGPLEEMLAGDALAARYTAATGEQLPATQIFTRATAGDPQAIAAIDEEAHWLAITVIAVKAILDPQVFVLGGGIGSRKELLPGIRTWLQKLGAHEIDIRSSELGHRAPVAGAVRLALNAVVSATEGQQR
ncbi:MAG: hypothetical protein JWP30_1686 [Homoserinimonas sp.]|nr:hypothetical protein [Homoserinimonas sp.]